MSQNQDYNSEIITWSIDRTPDFNIITYINTYFNESSYQDDINPLPTNFDVSQDNSNTSDDFIPFNLSSIQIPHDITISVLEFLVSDEDRNCCICMELRDSEEICRLNCHHLYCVQCINQHLERNTCCPVCRTNITNILTQNNNARNMINN
jgi:hypothetical protein